jgi:hypothetical protein
MHKKAEDSSGKASDGEAQNHTSFSTNFFLNEAFNKHSNARESGDDRIEVNVTWHVFNQEI